MRMIHSGKFANSQVLLVDKAPKISNDRTWCFWEKQNGFFENIVYKKWSSLNFFSKKFSSGLTVSPYQYKMIRGLDFYNYCFDEIKKQSNIEIIYDEVRDVRFKNNKAVINLSSKTIDAEKAIVFNSIYKPVKGSSDKVIHLLQHFKGWIIETDSPVFNPAVGTLMDFRVSQDKGTTFAYTLPFSETKALVEYTLFTDQPLRNEEYYDGLKEYINGILKTHNYKILEEEFGIIPMTNEKLSFYNKGIYYIGTAGGQTKASSGYTFQFIQKQSQQIIDYLISRKPLHSLPASPKRFLFYDTVLLRILAEKKLGGDEIFSRLFQRNKASSVFKFLDNETSLKEELKLIATLPFTPFLKASLKR